MYNMSCSSGKKHLGFGGVIFLFMLYQGPNVNQDYVAHNGKWEHDKCFLVLHVTQLCICFLYNLILLELLKALPSGSQYKRPTREGTYEMVGVIDHIA